MMREVGQIEWAETRVALPAFLTIALMPLSHSISNGVWFGLGSTILIGWVGSAIPRRCVRGVVSDLGDAWAWGFDALLDHCRIAAVRALAGRGTQRG